MRELNDNRYKTKQLTSGTHNISGFDVSPNGKEIVFALDYGIKSNIFTMTIDGEDKKQNKI